MIGKYILLWFPMVIIAILNGVARVGLYGKQMSELSAHQLSCFTAILFFGIYIWLIESQWPLSTSEQALTIGAIWLGMTICFEFLFGHYVIGHSWSKLFHDYNFFKGRLWILVLIWTTIGPWVIYKLRAK